MRSETACMKTVDGYSLDACKERVSSCVGIEQWRRGSWVPKWKWRNGADKLFNEGVDPLNYPKWFAKYKYPSEPVVQLVSRALRQWGEHLPPR